MNTYIIQFKTGGWVPVDEHVDKCSENASNATVYRDRAKEFLSVREALHYAIKNYPDAGTLVVQKQEGRMII